MPTRNCPNCGAAIDLNSIKCPYCDTPYLDLSAMELHKPFYLTVKCGDTVLSSKVILRNVTLTQEMDALPEITLECVGVCDYYSRSMHIPGAALYANNERIL